MLWQRVVTALVLIPFVVGALFYLDLRYVGAVVALLMAVGGWEWAKLAQLPQRHYQALFAVAFGGLTLALFYYCGLFAHGTLPPASLFLLWAVASGWWLVVMAGILLFPRGRRLWSRKPVVIGAGLLTLLPFAAALVAIEGLTLAGHRYVGPKMLLGLLVVVWCADTGAYFAGRRFGKRKLAPAVSPGKTWSGFIGGMAAAFVAALLLVSISGLPREYHFSLVVAAQTAAVVSVFGDLAESMFKRLAGIKDSGRILPGHGGLLDRIDSLCAALPVFLLICVALGAV